MEMVLESPAFGTVARGVPKNERALARFFASFPDYQVELAGHADNGETLVCWGTAQMTMTGNRFGVTPNGARAELPVFIVLTFADDLIAGERFSSICRFCAPSPGCRPTRCGQRCSARANWKEPGNDRRDAGQARRIRQDHGTFRHRGGPECSIRGPGRADRRLARARRGVRLSPRTVRLSRRSGFRWCRGIGCGSGR